MKLTARLSTLALVGALVLTGCGDSDKDSDKDAKADDKTTSSTSDDKSDSGDESDSPKTGEKVDIDDFLADLREGTENMDSAHMTMTMDVMGQKMSGEGDIKYDGETPSMAMKMSMGAQGSMEMRMVDGFLYMKMPGQGGDKWLKMDMEKAMSELGMGDLMEQMDPAAGFETYADAFTAATLVGEEKVDGEDTKHYTVTLDTSKVESFQKLPTGTDLPKTLDYDIWLDDDNRMRKTLIAIPGGGTVEMVISDFGKDVDVKAPPASEITDMPGM